MKIIIVSHGNFAKSILSSAEMILGKQENIFAFGLYPTDDTGLLRKRLEDTINDYIKDEEILFLTELSHGSPFNVVVSLMNEYPIYHITGTNLPLLLETISNRNCTSMKCEEMCANVIEKVKGSIYDVKRYLKEAM